MNLKKEQSPFKNQILPVKQILMKMHFLLQLQSGIKEDMLLLVKNGQIGAKLMKRISQKLMYSKVLRLNVRTVNLSAEQWQL